MVDLAVPLLCRWCWQSLSMTLLASEAPGMCRKSPVVLFICLLSHIVYVCVSHVLVLVCHFEIVPCSLGLISCAPCSSMQVFKLIVAKIYKRFTFKTITRLYHLHVFQPATLYISPVSVIGPPNPSTRIHYF